MPHDLTGVLKIALVVVLSSVVLTSIVAFYESREAALRSLIPLFLLCSLVGTLQVVAASSVVWVLGAFGVTMASWLFWQRRRK